jgi:hypothetical protein
LIWELADNLSGGRPFGHLKTEIKKWPKQWGIKILCGYVHTHMHILECTCTYAMESFGRVFYGTG